MWLKLKKNMLRESRCKPMRDQTRVLAICIEGKVVLLKYYAGKKICKTAEKGLSE